MGLVRARNLFNLLLFLATPKTLKWREIEEMELQSSRGKYDGIIVRKFDDIFTKRTNGRLWVSLQFYSPGTRLLTSSFHFSDDCVDSMEEARRITFNVHLGNKRKCGYDGTIFDDSETSTRFFIGLREPEIRPTFDVCADTSLAAAESFMFRFVMSRTFFRGLVVENLVDQNIISLREFYRKERIKLTFFTFGKVCCPISPLVLLDFFSVTRMQEVYFEYPATPMSAEFYDGLAKLDIRELGLRFSKNPGKDPIMHMSLGFRDRHLLKWPGLRIFAIENGYAGFSAEALFRVIESIVRRDERSAMTLPVSRVVYDTLSRLMRDQLRLHVYENSAEQLVLYNVTTQRFLRLRIDEDYGKTKGLAMNIVHLGEWLDFCKGFRLGLYPER